MPGTGGLVDYFLGAQRSLLSITTTSQWASKQLLCTHAVFQQSAYCKAHEVNSGEICSSKCLEMSTDLGDAGVHAVRCHRNTRALLLTSPQPAVISPVEKEVKIGLLGSALHLYLYLQALILMILN